MMRWTETHHPP